MKEVRTLINKKLGKIISLSLIIGAFFVVGLILVFEEWSPEAQSLFDTTFVENREELHVEVTNQPIRISTDVQGRYIPVWDKKVQRAFLCHASIEYTPAIGSSIPVVLIYDSLVGRNGSKEGLEDPSFASRRCYVREY